MRAELTNPPKGANCWIEVGLRNNLSTKPNVIINGVNATNSGSWIGNTWRANNYNCGGAPNQLNVSLTGSAGETGRCPCSMIGSLGRQMLKLPIGLNDQTVTNALVLPNDATSISAEIYQIHADDNNPAAWINDREVYDLKQNRTLKTYVNNNVTPPYQVGHILRAGPNTTRVKAYNRWYKWTSFYSLRGSYRANSCNAVFRGVH